MEPAEGEDAAAAAAEGRSRRRRRRSRRRRGSQAEKEEGGGASERVSWSRAEDATIVHSVAELGLMVPDRAAARPHRPRDPQPGTASFDEQDQQILRRTVPPSRASIDGAPPAPPVGDPNLSAVLGPVPRSSAETTINLCNSV